MEDFAIENDDFEFDRLLDDFMNGDYEEDVVEPATLTESKPAKAKKATSLADDFADIHQAIAEAEIKQEIKKEEKSGLIESLLPEEKSLFDAYRNFRDTIFVIADKNNLTPPKFNISADILYPKYKPSIGKAISKDSVIGWDILLKTHAPRLASIDHNATDEQLLDFAEKTTDEELQLAIISYVEILIEIEGCEISYERRKIANRKKRIEREIYLEFKQREDRIKRYIEKIKAQDFPINEEQLVKNYFKTARKDEEGAFTALITSPAIFSPILHNKMKAKFFGIIKPKPQDGIKINQKIGSFLKNLKA